MARDYSRHAVSPKVAVLLEVARLSRGLSFREAARSAGCSPVHLFHIEACVRAPSVALAEDIARTYRLTSLETAELLAESVDGAGRSKPSRRH